MDYDRRSSPSLLLYSLHWTTRVRMIVLSDDMMKEKKKGTDIWRDLLLFHSMGGMREYGDMRETLEIQREVIRMK